MLRNGMYFKEIFLIKIIKSSEFLNELQRRLLLVFGSLLDKINIKMNERIEICYSNSWNREALEGFCVLHINIFTVMVVRDLQINSC